MQNIIITGKINTTSNRNDDRFSQDNPTKTAYITVIESDVQKLKDFGLTEYTTRDGKENFFIIKLPQELTLVKGNKMTRLSGATDTPNLKTNKDMKMNIIQGENRGNKFYRLQAIQVDDYTDVEFIRQENPFGNGSLTEETFENDYPTDDLPF